MKSFLFELLNSSFDFQQFSSSSSHLKISTERGKEKKKEKRKQNYMFQFSSIDWKSNSSSCFIFMLFDSIFGNVHVGFDFKAC